MEGSTRRAGIVVGAAAAIAFVAAAFVLDGYVGAKNPTPVVDAAAGGTGGGTPAAQPSVVYVRPPASPQVIHVTQTASPQPAPVIHVVVPGGGENEDEAGEDGD